MYAADRVIMQLVQAFERPTVICLLLVQEQIDTPSSPSPPPHTHTHPLIVHT